MDRGPDELTITRRVQMPDELRIMRSLRAPELGPRILFFSGGTALRSVSRALKRYTHNSIHLVTPFDSGGSSQVLRRAFDMPSVGDLRSRMMALAEETARGNPEIYRLFAHRLPRDAELAALREELAELVAGGHALIRDVPAPMRQIIRTRLRYIAKRMTRDFDLRGASVGNLILAGGYLQNGRDMDAVLFEFSKLVEVRGLVRLVVADELQLAARCRDGTVVVGQHRITGKDCPPLVQPIEELYLTRDEQGTPAQARIEAEIGELIEGADVICFSVGSFFTSLIATLLPAGVGRAICRARCPKVYIPNLGEDPEQRGHDIASCARVLVRTVQRDAGERCGPADALNLVLVDSLRGRYATPADLSVLRGLGLQVADLRLAAAHDAGRLDPDAVARALLSLA